MEDARENMHNVAFIMMAVYSRLKNLCREAMPTISWSQKFKSEKMGHYSSEQ